MNAFFGKITLITCCRTIFTPLKSTVVEVFTNEVTGSDVKEGMQRNRALLQKPITGCTEESGFFTPV